MGGYAPGRKSSGKRDAKPGIRNWGIVTTPESGGNLTYPRREALKCQTGQTRTFARRESGAWFEIVPLFSVFFRGMS